MISTISACSAKVIHSMVDKFVIEVDGAIIFGHSYVHVVQYAELRRFDTIMVPNNIPDTQDVGGSFGDLVSYIWAREEGRDCVQK